MELVEISVRGHIAEDWSGWLGGLTVTHTQDGETVLSGAVRDQAALRGLLDRIADLGFQLSSVASTRQGEMESEVHTRNANPVLTERKELSCPPEQQQ
jgi:hypothetical protein